MSTGTLVRSRREVRDGRPTSVVRRVAPAAGPCSHHQVFSPPPPAARSDLSGDALGRLVAAQRIEVRVKGLSRHDRRGQAAELRHRLGAVRHRFRPPPAARHHGVGHPREPPSRRAAEPPRRRQAETKRLERWDSWVNGDS